MRWHELFSDLEGQGSSLQRADTDREIADRTRGELAQVTLLNRLRASVSSPVTVWVAGAGEIRGELLRVGADWFLVATTDEVIVPVPALVGVLNLPPAAVSKDGAGIVASRLRLSSVLRAVARDRSTVRIVLRDGGDVVGTLDRIGADFVDVSMHGLDEPPRPQHLRGRVTVGFAAIGCVRRQPAGWG
jgi:small nuclear ribonucleoprotein (snRNP)-like protein